VPAANAGAGDVATSPTPPAPLAVPPVPTVRGEDRNIVGSSLVVGKDEIVHTVTVTGGAAKIYGTVTGDLVVAGGSAKIEPGGRVVGNATVFGGSLKVESGARVDGDVGIVGGVLKREEGAIVGGKVVDSSSGHAGATKVTVHDGEVSTEVETKKRTSGRSRLTEAVSSFGHSVSNMSLLFVFGCVLLALATRKMETLRVEVAARPMKSFAMGIVGAFCGLIAITAMCITVVGIPFALLAALLAVFSVYASIAAVLTTFGAAVAGHKWKNPYVHLLVGCVAFLVVGLIPFVGGLATLVLVMISIGALVSTRLAGVVKRRTPKPDMV
jgi:predicted membrane protein